MNIDTLKSLWRRHSGGDTAAAVSAWDSVAADYVFDARINFEDEPFLKFIAECVPLTREMTALDVGCGAGAYSMALAARVKHADGVDFSPRMIALAQDYARAHGIANADFRVCDWFNCDDTAFRGRYDLVFAHTTPAVSDFDTLMKLMRASKQYCFLCMPSRRSDQVMDAVREIAGAKGNGSDDSVAYAFDTIWAAGGNPLLRYQDTVWKSKKTLADAQSWYLNRARGAIEMSTATEEKIKAYLRGIACDGMVEETIHTKLVNIFWEVRA